MFNLFRAYVPGFRVRAQNEVPGFNIDENGFPRDQTGWLEPMLPETATVRDSDVAQPMLPHTTRVPIPGPEDGPADYPVKPQDNVPGFNFRESGSGVPQQETTWFDGMWPGSPTSQYFNFAQTLTSPPAADGSAEPGSQQLPEWLYKLVTMPLPEVSTVIDPRTGRRIVPYEPLISPVRSYLPTEQDGPGTEDARVDVDAISSRPDSGSVATPSIGPWPSSEVVPQGVV
jgi:hypothetical protein